MRPQIVCLCGSTRFYSEFQERNFAETMNGNIVLSVGFYPHAAERPDQKHVTPEEKQRLDLLHLHKIDMADRVVFLNKGGYMGESTTRELAYAVFSHKDLDWFDRRLGEQWMIRERHLLGAMLAAFVDGLPHLGQGMPKGNRLGVWQRMEQLWKAHQSELQERQGA